MRRFLTALLIIALTGCELATLDATSSNRYVRAGFDVSPELVAAGGGREQTGYLGAGVAALLPLNDKIATGVQLELNYNHNISRKLALEFALSSATQDIKIAGLGKLNTLGLSAMVQTGKPSGSAKWYTGAGIAYLVNEISDTGIDADNALGLLIAAGVELPINGMLDACIEARCQIAHTEASTGNALNQNALLLRGNFVFKF